MAREPFLPLFFGDFLASTYEWAGEERSLYLTLLAHQWVGGSIPADARDVCNVVRWDWELFSRCWRRVSIKFSPMTNEWRSANGESMANAMQNDSERHQSANGGRLQNARLEEHRAKAARLSVTNSESGKKGAAARWTKKNGESMANAMQNDSERHQSANGGAPMAPSHPILKNSLSHTRACAQGAESVPRETDSTRVELDDVPSQLVEALKQVHPHGTYRQAAWLLAEREIRGCLEEGYTPEEMFEGDKRYALQAQATGSVGTQFVVGPDRFFRERMFREPFPLPAEEKRGKGPTAAEAEEDAMRKLTGRRVAMGIPEFRDPNPGESADEYRHAQNVAWNAKQPRDVHAVAARLAKSKAVA